MMEPRTIFLARLIGLGALSLAAAMLLNRPTMLGTVNLIFREPAFVLTYSTIALLAGLALVLAHNVWSGGALPVVITLFGWLVLIRALLALLLSPATTVRIAEALLFAQFYTAYMVAVFGLGVYLTYSGFTLRSSAP